MEPGNNLSYFKNVHSILFELINRQTAHLKVREEVDTILALPEVPERIIAKIMDLINRSLHEIENTSHYRIY